MQCIERSRRVCFGVVVLIIFLHIAFVSDRPDEPSISGFKDLFALASARFFPTGFYQWVVFDIIDHAVPQTLFSWTIFVAAIWVGALCNVFERYCQGGMLWLVLSTIGYFIWKRAKELHTERRLYQYLLYYTLLAIGFWVSSVMLSYVDLHWHLHHYCWPLLLLPATGKTGIHNLIMKGVLVGICLNGAARWGFSSLVETGVSIPAHWPPAPPPVATVNETHVHLQWNNLPKPFGGVNVVVNGVMVASGFKIEQTVSVGLRRGKQKEYIHYQPFKEDYFRGLTMGEFSPFATLYLNGSLVPLPN